jgi:DNA-binding NarL/FixJ family response regulator
MPARIGIRSRQLVANHRIGPEDLIAFHKEIMEPACTSSSNSIGVLVADSNQMQCQLLVGAFRRRPEFRVTSCILDTDAILHVIGSVPVEVAILNADNPRDGWPDMTVVRRLHLSHPEVAKIILLDNYDREIVVNAFRSGARGLFCFSQYPFRLLCKCIHSVHRGQVWANSEQMQYVIDSLSQVPSLHMVNSRGIRLLTPREEQVVALVADGLSNREVAQELCLSEHTIKKYLFRIFDKLGISSRVELVLYALSHGGSRQAEWVAGANA